LLGANGAGKSTLCAALAGGLPLQAGSIELDGAAVSDLPAHRRAAAGLVLAPESRGVFPMLSVEENLHVWLRSRTDVGAVFDRFPILRERRRLAAGNLSGGEQQLLTLAPLLVHTPRVVIADEPTLGLAPLVVRQILEIMSGLRERDVALLLVEEKVRSLLDTADVVAFLQLGRVVWSGAAEDVDERELAAAYLGSV
jgi:ABC-type branched-subunit amino acid transport system ATPase component